MGLEEYDFHFNFKQSEETSKLELFVQKIKNLIFSLQYILLKYQTSSMWLEILSMIVQLFQLLFFSFDQTVKFLFFNQNYVKF